MSIADDLNSIRTHLEDDYEALEQLGVSVEDRNIENIKDMANQIYSKFPKTDFVEGTNITLENTIKGKLDFDNLLYGDTSQETLNGYQILQLSDVPETTTNGVTYKIQNNKLYINGTVTTSFAVINMSANFPSDTYTISAQLLEGTTPGTTNCSFYSANSSSVRNTAIFGYQYTPSTATADIVKIASNLNAGAVFNNAVIGFMIEKGSTKHDFEPYCGGIPSPNPNYLQDIQVVTGEQEIEVFGKNLFNKEKPVFISSGNMIVTPITNGVNISVGVATAFVLYKIGKMKDVIGKTYTFSTTTTSEVIRNSRFVYCDEDGSNRSNLGNELGENTSLSTTIPSGDYGEKILCLRLYVARPSEQTTYSIDINNVQVEVGSTATSYQPYTSRTYTLHLGDLEFAKIGAYADEILYDINNDKFYKKQKIGKYTFDGDVNKIVWSISTSSITGLYAFWFLKETYPKLNIVNSNLDGKNLKITNNFTYNYQEWKSVTSPCLCENSYLRPDMIIFSGFSDITTIEQWNTWLSSHNTTMYYILKTETLTEITNTTLKEQLKDLYNMQSMSGTTNITVSGDLPFILKVRALKGE
jgi:hypothetical protein